MRVRRALLVAAVSTFVPALLLIPLPGSPASALQESATIFYEDTKTKDIIRRAIQDEEHGRWKEAIGRYLQALEKYPNENHPIVEENGKEIISFTDAKGAGRRVGVREFIFSRLKRMPPDALRIYRDDLGFNAKARREFDEGRKTGDTKRIEQAVERWFFASSTDEALDYLANGYLESGNVDTAIQCWKRILNAYPDSDIPAPIILTKIARASACHPSLTLEGKWASDIFQVSGDDKASVIVNDVAGRPSDAVRYTPAPSVTSRGGGRREPFIKTPEEIFFPEPRVTRGDVRNWSEAFFEQDDSLSRTPEMRYIERGVYPGLGDLKPSHSPYVPIAVIQDGKPYVVAQNGFSAVAVNPENGKRYWQEQFGKKPTISGETVRQYGGGFFLRPVVFGCATDGKVVYLNQYSMQSRVSGSPAGLYPSSIRAVNLRTGKLVWDSEEVNPRAAEEKDLAFAMPPIVAGDQVYVASTTAPSGEQEVYVSAYDKRTGRLLWQTFICSLYGTNVYRGYPMSMRSPPTITVSGGMLYCQTNIGCIASVNGASGHIVWLTEYQRASVGAIRRGGDGEIQMRSGAHWSMPIVFRNTLYALPSDAEDLNAIHKETGKIIKDRFRNDANRKPWISLNAVSDRYLAVSSTAETIIDLQNPETPMTLTGAPAVGKGIFFNNILYVPNAAGITMYTPGSWRIYGETAKWDPSVAGNIAVCGDHIVVQSSDGARLTDYTSHDTILRSTAFKVRMEPVEIEPLLDYARKMMKSERYPDAIDGFRRLLWLVKDLKGYEETESEAKDNLFSAYRRLGERSRMEFASGSTESGPKAVEMYTESKEYAAGDTDVVAATLSLARILEQTGRFADAVAQYQELIERFSNRCHPCDEKDESIEENVRSFARRQIGVLIRSHGPTVYAAVEREAGRFYGTIPAGDRKRIFALLDRYPNSAAAADAVTLIDDGYRREARWSDRADFLKRIDHDHNGLMDEVLLQRELVLSLRMAKRWGEWSEELADLAARHDGKEIHTSDGLLKVNDLVKKEREAAADPIPAVKPLIHPLKAIAHMPPGAALFRPSGNRPPTLTSSAEIMIFPGSVELRAPSVEQPLWRIVHPGAYTGIDLGETTEMSAQIEAIAPGSPAAKAGLKREDAIVAVNGKPVEYRTGRAILAAAPIGVECRVNILRLGKSMTVAMTPEPWPASLTIPLIDAAWNREGSLIVAWEDATACFDQSNGALLWMTPCSASDRKISAIAALDDGVLIAETLAVRPRIPESIDRSRPTITPIDFNRLTYLDSLSGEVRWTRSFPLTTELFRSGYGRPITTVAASGGRTAFIIASAPGSRPSEIIQSAMLVDGGTGVIRETRSLGQRFMIDIDRANGRAALIIYDNRDAFTLACLSFNAETNGGRTGELWTRPLTLRLHNWWGEQDPPMMSINRETIAVIADPNFVRTYAIADAGKESTLSLPDGRAIVPRTAACALSANGMLYVYNHLQADTSNAFMTAFNTREGKIVWDGPAPANGGSYPQILVDHPNFVVLFAANGILPGASGGYSPTCLIYAVEKQGYIVHEFQELNIIQPAPAARGAVWIGRSAFFVNTRKQLDVYGNE